MSSLSTLLDRWLELEPAAATQAIEGCVSDWPIEAYALATLILGISAQPDLRLKLENSGKGWHVVLVDQGLFDATFRHSGDTAAEALLAAYLAWLEYLAVLEVSK